MGWRDFCLGSIAGAAISLSRPPAGISLEEWMTPSGARQGVWRAGALTVIAMALLVQRPRREDERMPVIEWALGAAIGFALHGFVLVDLIPVGSQVAWVLALLVALALMLALGGRSAKAEAVEASDASSSMQPFFIALCGAGLSLALAAVNSRACLLSPGTRDDDTVAGAVAFGMFALAALAFGPLFASRKFERPLFPMGVALAAALALLSFEFLGALSIPDAYDNLMKQFGLHSGLRGTFVYDALIAARAFALPALCAGVAMAAAGSASSVAWALLGAAAASIFQSHWSKGFDATTVDAIAIQAAERAAGGAALAAAGALLVALTRHGPEGRARMIHAMIPAACMCAALLRAPEPALPISPWERIAPRVEWMRETPEGLLSIEFQATRGRVAMLDRRRLTPTVEEVPADELRLRKSIHDRKSSVVIAGLMTPERVQSLHRMELAAVFAVTPWPSLEREMQTAMFAGATAPEDLKIDFIREWETHAGATQVGTIVAPPVEASARSLACLDRLAAPTRIGWLPAHQEIAQLDWGESVLVSCTHLDDFAIGVVRGDRAARVLLPAGEPRTSWTTSRVARIDIAQREHVARTRTAERLMRAADNPVMEALRRFCAVQVQSSPFETRSQRTELDASAIELLRQSGLAAEPRDFERELDVFVATTLKEKRDLEGLIAFARPLADAYPTWAGMQRAAAAADWEFMEWSRASRRLEKVVGASPHDGQARLWLAEALLRAGEPAAAVKVADELLVIQPRRVDALKLRAIAAIHAGDSRGREWLEALLREHPKDAQLAPYKNLGTLPPLWPPLGIPGEIAPSPGDH